jgi:hypothetical protein
MVEVVAGRLQEGPAVKTNRASVATVEFVGTVPLGWA